MAARIGLGRRRRRRGTAIAVSVAVHAAVLAILAISAPDLRLPTARFAPDVTVFLEPMQPRLRLQSSSAAPRAANAPAPKAVSPPQAASVVTPRPAVLPPPPRPALPTPGPASPTPAPAAPTAVAGSGTSPSAAPGDGRDWRVRPQGGDVHGLVHEAIGCGHAQYLKLTSAEQAACDRKFASLRGQELPHFDAIPPEKRAYYDAVMKKREDQRYAAFRDLDALQRSRPAFSPPDHGLDANVGFHCTFKFGVGAAAANKAAGNRLGFPPCPIRLPGADPPPP